MIITLHITDQKLYNNYDFVLKIQINAERRHLHKHQQILKHILALVDFLALKFKIDHKVQQKLTLSRKEKYKKAKENFELEKKKNEKKKNSEPEKKPEKKK